MFELNNLIELRDGKQEEVIINDDRFSPLLHPGDVITVEAVEDEETDALLLVKIADTYYLARLKTQQGYLFVYDYAGLLIGKFDQLEEMTLPITVIGLIKNLP